MDEGAEFFEKHNETYFFKNCNKYLDHPKRTLTCHKISASHS